MKAVLALCLLCILQVSTTEEERSLSGGAAGDPAQVVLDREVREAGKKKREKKENKKEIRKARRRAARKKAGWRKETGRARVRKGGKGKKCNGGRKNCRGKKKAARRSRKMKEETMKTSARQGNTCLLKDSVTTIKKYSKAVTELNSLRRIFNFRSQMKGKKENSNGTFADSLAAMKDSMGGGQSCEGAPSAADTAAAKAVHDKLANCSTTAAAMCDETAAGAAVNESALIPCNSTLPKFVSDFKKCFTGTTAASTVCTCVAALTIPGDECMNFQASAKKLKAQKKKCTQGGTAGSFGDCRKQERKAAKYGNMCKKSCSTGMTTSAPSGRVNLLRRLNQKMLQKMNLN